MSTKTKSQKASGRARCAHVNALEGFPLSAAVMVFPPFPSLLYILTEVITGSNSLRSPNQRFKRFGSTIPGIKDSVYGAVYRC